MASQHDVHKKISGAIVFQRCSAFEAKKRDNGNSRLEPMLGKMMMNGCMAFHVNHAGATFPNGFLEEAAGN